MPRARPYPGFSTEGGRFVLDTDASLFAVGGVLSQLQENREVVIAYASRSLQLSQRRYCTTRRVMLAAVVMCTHFRSYLRGAQFTLRTDHSSLRWLQRFLTQLHSNTVRGHSTQTRMACLGNVVSASVLTARCRRRIRRLLTPTQRPRCWISLSPRQK